MKAVMMLLLLAVTFLCGCATTIEDRKKERLTTYSQLQPEAQTLVDTGQIKVGMPKDAVYIAWGKPDQVVQSESDQGRNESWLYHDSYLVPYSYWSYGYGGWGSYYHPYYYAPPYLMSDFYPQYYVRREVQFQNDQVKHWRSLPRPPY
jgi:hypothetical protein